MVADECEFCHEDLCIAKHELGKEFKCKGMVQKGIVIECHASNDDLVQACCICDNQADAEFPYEEYCKSCAKEKIKDAKRK